jgi:SAM-dependent methyltransferase
VHVTANGKVSLDHIYVQPDPRAYFRTLRDFDYHIPQLAKPYFLDIIEEYRREYEVPSVNVLGVGCSYGVNAALIALDTTMDELYKRYCSLESQVQNRSALLARDLLWARTRRSGRTRFVGLDSSQSALSYAFAAGFIDEAVCADLEKDEPTEQQREQLRGIELVISTGCLGYATDRTIARIVEAGAGRMPWMAHFVLRMFPFDPVAKRLAEAGYDTVSVNQVFKQRLFASPEEQALVLDTLSSEGVDPRGLEADGWLYAGLHISRPRGTKTRMVFDVAPNSHHDSVPSPNHRGRGCQ